MFLGYNTNGLAHHDLFDAVDLVADMGYRGIAITVDHGVLSPYDRSAPEQLDQLALLLKAMGMRSVIETGTRYLLDARRKHEPTLVSADPPVAAAACSSTGTASTVPDDSVVIAFRFGPVSYTNRLLTMPSTRDWSKGSKKPSSTGQSREWRSPSSLSRGCSSTPRFGSPIFSNDFPGNRYVSRSTWATCSGQGEIPIAEQIVQWQSRLANVHFDDAVAGRHEHLPFGEGEIEFGPVIDALRQIGYQGGVYVELSRHSHMGPEAAQSAYDFLAPLMQKDEPTDA